MQAHKPSAPPRFHHPRSPRSPLVRASFITNSHCPHYTRSTLVLSALHAAHPRPLFALVCINLGDLPSASVRGKHNNGLGGSAVEDTSYVSYVFGAICPPRPHEHASTRSVP